MQISGGSYTESDFVDLAPVAFDPFYDTSAPRAMVALNGTRYVPLSYEITFNAHGATDEATIKLPISTNPDFSILFFKGTNTDATSGPNETFVGGGPLGTTPVPVLLPDGTLNPAAKTLEDDTPVYVEIYAGFPSSPAAGSTDISQLSQRFLGVVDSYSARPTDDLVTLTCRSLAAPLIDLKITHTVINMTGAQFAASAASIFGLNSSVLLRPRQKSFTIAEVLGKEFVGGTNLTAGIFNKTYWQILLQCALFDDVDVWVSGNTLNYAAPDKIARKTIKAKYGHNIAVPDLNHSVQFNKNIRVEVRTYQSRTRTSTTWRVESNAVAAGGVTQSYRTKKIVTTSPLFGTNDIVSNSTSSAGVTSTIVSSSSGGGFTGVNRPGSESGLQRYVYYIPDLSPAKCNALALSYWRQISQNQYSVDFEMAVTAKLLPIFDITSLIDVSGLPYSFFNDRYWPRRIEETLDPDKDGWTWRIQATNTMLPMGAV
jgi:hypothetical protein